MSLFDPPKQEKLSDVYPPGATFWLQMATYEGLQTTSYGERVQASVIVSSEKHGGTQSHFRVWGSLAEQIGAMEDSDLPARVSVEQEGRRNVWRRCLVQEDTAAATVPDPDDGEPPY